MTRVRILLVDASDARELTARLEALGYRVDGIATTGEEAVAAAVRSAPELLLIDATPDAATTAAAIVRHRPMPVVFMGAEADESSLRPRGPVEPLAFLAKPFSDRELRATLELVLCRHASARTAHEFGAYFDASLDMLCFLGFNGYFKRLNPAWERTLGFTREALMSRPFIEFVHPEDRERTLQQNAAVRAGGQAAGFENRYVCKDGSYRWLLWNAAPQFADGVIYSAARDITARKQAETERAELIRTLEASLAEVRSLQEILPICSYCRKIRDDANYWHTVESYLSQHTKTMFSHGICPDCMAAEIDPDLTADDAT